MLSVFNLIHWGNGLFCFWALANFCLTLKLLLAGIFSLVVYYWYVIPVVTQNSAASRLFWSIISEANHEWKSSKEFLNKFGFVVLPALKKRENKYWSQIVGLSGCTGKLLLHVITQGQCFFDCVRVWNGFFCFAKKIFAIAVALKTKVYFTVLVIYTLWESLLFLASREQEIYFFKLKSWFWTIRVSFFFFGSNLKEEILVNEQISALPRMHIFTIPSFHLVEHTEKY